MLYTVPETFITESYSAQLFNKEFFKSVNRFQNPFLNREDMNQFKMKQKWNEIPCSNGNCETEIQGYLYRIICRFSIEFNNELS